MSSPAERRPTDEPPRKRKRRKYAHYEVRRRLRSGTAAAIVQTRYRR